MSSIGVTSLERIPVGTSTDRLLKALYRDGSVIVTGLVGPEALQEIKSEVAAADDRKTTGVFNEQTRLVTGLAAKSPAAVEAVLRHEMIKAVREDVLTRKTDSWWGDERNTSISPPLLSVFMSSRVGPGGKRQGLHRDDQDHHMTHKHRDPKETTMLFCSVALSKTTRENGATEVVPGSWAWDDLRKPELSEVTYAEMDPGDCTLMLGNVYHGAGSNTTTDQYRHVLISVFCPGVYRTEENQFLTVTQSQVEKYPEDVQDLLGWRASTPYLGWYELDHPFNVFRKNSEKYAGLS